MWRIDVWGTCQIFVYAVYCCEIWLLCFLARQKFTAELTGSLKFDGTCSCTCGSRGRKKSFAPKMASCWQTFCKTNPITSVKRHHICSIGDLYLNWGNCGRLELDEEIERCNRLSDPWLMIAQLIKAKQRLCFCLFRVQWSKLLWENADYKGV